jgi:6-phospho-beta-glucosidase
VVDEQVPLRYGLVGQETTGAGGFSMALRTIPVMLEYARLIEQVAPDAWVVNFTNPAGLITQALRDSTTARVVGICDTPTAMKRTLARFFEVPPEEVDLDNFGLNHLGWVRGVVVEGRERMPEVLDRY